MGLLLAAAPVTPMPAAFESRRVRNGGTYHDQILSSGSAVDADVLFCVIR